MPSSFNKRSWKDISPRDLEEASEERPRPKRRRWKKRTAQFAEGVAAGANGFFGTELAGKAIYSLSTSGNPLADPVKSLSKVSQAIGGATLIEIGVKNYFQITDAPSHSEEKKTPKTLLVSGWKVAKEVSGAAFEAGVVMKGIHQFGAIASSPFLPAVGALGNVGWGVEKIWSRGENAISALSSSPSNSQAPRTSWVKTARKLAFPVARTLYGAGLVAQTYQKFQNPDHQKSSTLSRVVHGGSEFAQAVIGVEHIYKGVRSGVKEIGSLRRSRSIPGSSESAARQRGSVHRPHTHGD